MDGAMRVRNSRNRWWVGVVLGCAGEEVVSQWCRGVLGIFGIGVLVEETWVRGRVGGSRMWRECGAWWLVEQGRRARGGRLKVGRGRWGFCGTGGMDALSGGWGEG